MPGRHECTPSKSPQNASLMSLSSSPLPSLCLSVTCEWVQPPSVHPFPCRTCKKSFTAAAAMEAHHAAVHMGPSGTSFLCGMCSKPFGEKAWLEQHHRDAHPGRDIGTTFPPLPATFICPQCSAPLRSGDCLEKHMQMKHPGEYGGVAQMLNETHHLLHSRLLDPPSPGTDMRFYSAIMYHIGMCVLVFLRHLMCSSMCMAHSSPLRQDPSRLVCLV